MIPTLFQVTGGIGLFLLGMVLLTDGLKAFAGEALRQALVRFTGTPLKAFGSGALVTAMVQSSSATTVTVIGFVSAGLLTFPQAIGVVFGASLGTTATGWIVSVLGLKVSLGFYALPLVGAGAFMKILGGARVKSLGLALAGFGLIFVGIETLQEGMRGLSGIFNLAGLPAGGAVGYFLAMLIGIFMTVILQSSSAAVATTLTALHTEAINFEQAASLVIGSAIGTTVTGALAAIGGSISARRTALAHVLFNLGTGLIAVMLLPLFLWGIELAQVHLKLEPGATSLAAFHTLFIAAGVAIFFPFINPFSRWIERLLPEKGPEFTRNLDDSLHGVPEVAMEATKRSLSETACGLFRSVKAMLDAHGHASGIDEGRLLEIGQSLDRIQQFFSKIPSTAEHKPLSELRVSQMHAMDHLVRMYSSLRLPASIRQVLGHEQLGHAVACGRKILELGEAGLHGESDPDWLKRIEKAAADLAELRRRQRGDVMAQTAVGKWGPVTALEILDAMRWLDRLGYHAWRICRYLGDSKITETPEPALAGITASSDE